MVRKALKLLLAVGMAFVASGCWDALNVEDRDICTAVVVDYKDGLYWFYVEVASITSKQNSQNGQGMSQGSGISIVKASGKTLADARIDLDKELNQPIFLGAVQALIMTERMVDGGIYEYANRVRQMVEYRKTMDVIVISDNPEDFLGISPVNESTVGFAVEDTIQTMINQGSTFHMSLAELLEKLESKNPCYLMATLSIINDRVTLVGYTVFIGGYRKGFIPYEQSRGIIYLSHSLIVKPRIDYVISAGEDRFTLDTELQSLKIDPDYQEGVVSFKLNFQFKATPLYASSIAPITQGVRSVLVYNLTQQLLSDLSQTVQLSQTYGSDYLSFSEPFRIHYPDIYDRMDWLSVFKKARFEIRVNVDMERNEAVDYNPDEVGEQ